MVSALLFGAIASSALVIGAVLGAYWSPPKAFTATIVAFASGALIIALAFDLFEHAFELGGLRVAGGGLLAGAGVFTVVDYAIDERYGKDSSGMGLLASVTLDGIPENTALGVVLIGNANALALLAAIFASNFPEALGGAQGIADRESKAHAVGIWVATAVILTLSVVFGNRVFAGIGETPLAFVRAFAGGAVIASLATEVMPEAFDEGGIYVGFASAVGFLFAFALK